MLGSNAYTKRYMPYFKLMRLDNTTGVWLSLLPSWAMFAVIQQHSIWQSLGYMVLFFIGAMVVRSAGCIINDIVDRKIDAQVWRTKGRPLVVGAISINQAVILATLLLIIGGIIVLLLHNVLTMIIAIILVIGIVLYPLTKRFLSWPQVFLGLVFNGGVILASVAVLRYISFAAVMLYIGSVLWTIGYDTIYAHQDKDDDLKLGLNSIALADTPQKKMLRNVYMLCFSCWMVFGLVSGLSNMFIFGMFFVGVVLFYQVYKVNLDDRDSCMKMFRLNVLVGALLVVSCLLGRI